jgi:hypothetical protein
MAVAFVANLRNSGQHKPFCLFTFHGDIPYSWGGNLLSGSVRV